VTTPPVVRGMNGVRLCSRAGTFNSTEVGTVAAALPGEDACGEWIVPEEMEPREMTRNAPDANPDSVCRTGLVSDPVR
jgi:hypothetical protein